MVQGFKTDHGAVKTCSLHQDEYTPRGDHEKALPSTTYSRRCLSVRSVSKGVEDNTRRTNPSNPQSGRQRFPMLREWWLEGMACLITLFALAAVVLTLYPHQKKPLPQWPYRLSVNILLSIYIVVMKAALMYILAQGLGQLKWSWLQSSRPLHDLVKFDDASRGALGSLLLLSTTHIRYLLASFGVTLLTTLVALDLVTQELVRYYGCTSQIASAKAAIPRTSRWWNDNGAPIHWHIRSIVPEMQAATNTGVFSKAAQVSFSCQTGNWTFPSDSEYSSVGYCSQCYDISNQVQAYQWCSKFPNPINRDDRCKGSRDTFTNTSLPSGLTVESSTEAGTLHVSAMRYDQMSDIPLQILAGQSPYLSPLYRNSDMPDYLAPVCRTAAENATVLCGHFQATGCSLYPCVRTHNATTRNGVFEEQLLETTPPRMVRREGHVRGLYLIDT